MLNKITDYVKRNRVALFSGFVVLAVLSITLVTEYFNFRKTGGLTGNIESAMKTAFVSVSASIFAITGLNLVVSKKREQQVKRRLQVSDTLLGCITVLAEEQNINEAIDRLLKILNDYFDGDRAYLFEFDYENVVTNNSYEYAAEGVTKEIDKLQNIPMEVIDSWIHKFEETGTFFISSIDKDVDRDSDTYRILEMQQIESLIAVPLIENEEIIGFLGIDNPKVNYDDLSLLSSATFFILDSIDRRESHAMLQKFSFEDNFTGVYNRNKFNTIIDGFAGKVVSDIGVAYFDLNGLKEINDTKGHGAGDTLIKTSARCVDDIFRGCTYRIGGDEFVVIKTNVEKTSFENDIQKVLASLKEENISVSYGVTWVEKCPDVEHQLSVADKLMYADKIRHYKNV